MAPDTMFRNIYDGHISLKEFERWFKLQLDKAYQDGIKDALEESSYDDVSKSQYD
jgi:hypothetical protein